jgi:tetratricopeptide (TPR) repeat protein
MGGLVKLSGQPDRAKALWLDEWAIELARELGDKRVISRTLNNLATSMDWFLNEKGAADARQLNVEALGLRREIDDRSGISQSLNNLGELARSEGNYVHALELYSESLSIAEALGQTLGIDGLLSNIAYTLYHMGEYPRAQATFRRALLGASEVESKSGVAYILVGYALIASALGQGRRSALLLGAATYLLEEIDEVLDKLEAIDYEHAIAVARNQLGNAFQSTYQEGRAMSMEQAIDYALAEEPGLPSELSQLL